jgi:hypothetical protein
LQHRPPSRSNPDTGVPENDKAVAGRLDAARRAFESACGGSADRVLPLAQYSSATATDPVVIMAAAAVVIIDIDIMIVS